MVGEQGEEEKEESQERRTGEHSMSAFSECFGLFLKLVLHKEFPFTESLESCISPASMPMVSADLCKDAAGIVL